MGGKAIALALSVCRVIILRIMMRMLTLLKGNKRESTSAKGRENRSVEKYFPFPGNLYCVVLEILGRDENVMIILL